MEIVTALRLRGYYYSLYKNTCFYLFIYYLRSTEKEENQDGIFCKLISAIIPNSVHFRKNK